MAPSGRGAAVGMHQPSSGPGLTSTADAVVSSAASITDPIRADYGGACLTGLVPRLLARSEAAWLPAELTEAASVVVLVIDGLGWPMLAAHQGALPLLCSLPGRPITTVAPST